jgi:hypothetical protein
MSISKTTARTVNFRLILTAPPSGVDFGVQSGRGASYRTIGTQRSGGGDLHFEFSVEARVTASPGAVDFRGPVVQGPPGARFVYVDIGTCAGQTGTPWSRRLKVPLSGISPKMLDDAAAQPEMVLAAEVPGTGADGGPSCASVKAFGGWRLSA